MLERLFDIRRFSDVEEWLADRARARPRPRRGHRGHWHRLARLADVLAGSCPRERSGLAEVPAVVAPRAVAGRGRARVSTDVSTTIAAVTPRTPGRRPRPTPPPAATRRCGPARPAGRWRSSTARPLRTRPTWRRVDAARRAATLCGHLLALERAVSDETAAADEVARTRGQPAAASGCPTTVRRRAGLGARPRRHRRARSVRGPAPRAPRGARQRAELAEPPRGRPRRGDRAAQQVARRSSASGSPPRLVARAAGPAGCTCSRSGSRPRRERLAADAAG